MFCIFSFLESTRSSFTRILSQTRSEFAPALAYLESHIHTLMALNFAKNRTGCLGLCNSILRRLSRTQVCCVCCVSVSVFSFDRVVGFRWFLCDFLLSFSTPFC
jgi:hypothetical protein